VILVFLGSCKEPPGDNLPTAIHIAFLQFSGFWDEGPGSDCSTVRRREPVWSDFDDFEVLVCFLSEGNHGIAAKGGYNLYFIDF